MESQLIIQPQQVFEGHTARIFSLALCTLPNGNRIAASASHDRTVRIWCLMTNSHIRTIQYSDFVWRVFLAITATGRVCVVAFVSAEDKIHVTDFETGEDLFAIAGRLVYAGVVSLYNSPVIISLINDIDIAIVDIATGKYLRFIRGGFEKAFRAVVSHGTRPMLVFNTWNAQNRRSSIQAYELFLANPTSAETAISPTSTITSSAQSAHALDGWTKFEGAPRDEPIIPEKMKIVFEGDSRDGITSLVISQNYKPTICSGHYDNVVRVWDLASLQLLLTLEGHADWVVSVTIWKGIEPIVVSGSSDGTIKVWDLQTGALVLTCEGHLRDVWAVTVTTGPRPLIVSASADRTVRTWDINQAVLDMKWVRRRDFCMFLCSSGMQPRPSECALKAVASPPASHELQSELAGLAIEADRQNESDRQRQEEQDAEDEQVALEHLLNPIWQASLKEFGVLPSPSFLDTQSALISSLQSQNEYGSTAATAAAEDLDDEATIGAEDAIENMALQKYFPAHGPSNFKLKKLPNSIHAQKVFHSQHMCKEIAKFF